jgi:hypothetical protein
MGPAHSEAPHEYRENRPNSLEVLASVRTAACRDSTADVAPTNKLNAPPAKIKLSASWTKGGGRSCKVQYSLLMRHTAPRGGQCRERNSDCFGDHRCAGGVRNYRTRIGPSRTIGFWPLWVRPQGRALSWVRATLRLRGISIRLPAGLRRRQHLLLLCTRILRLSVRRTSVFPSSAWLESSLVGRAVPVDAVTGNSS